MRSSTMPPTAPQGSSFSVTVLGGAIGRVSDGAMAYTGRDARFDVSADAEWDDPALDESVVTGSGAMAIVGPDAITGRYVNEVADSGPVASDDLRGREARSTRRPQAGVDPDNVFHLNHNIAPTARAAAGDYWASDLEVRRESAITRPARNGATTIRNGSWNSSPSRG